MEVTIVVILLLLGIAFFLLELFLIPGVSIAGIAGTLFVLAAVYYSYTTISPMAGHITLVGGASLMGISIWLFLRSRALEKMSLQTTIDGKNDPLKDMNIQVGDAGIALSRLAPMGNVRINNQTVEAKTYDDFIDEGELVVVKQVFSTNVLVERNTH